MKKDLATTIITAIVGFIISFLVVSNLIIKDPAPVPVKSPQTIINSDLSEPNVEIFNYRAINPTVEAYVDCTNYDLTGNCVNSTDGETVVEQSTTEENTTEESVMDEESPTEAEE